MKILFLTLLTGLYCFYCFSKTPKIAALKNPRHEKSVIFDKGQYYPSKLIVKQGDELRLFFANLSPKQTCLYEKSLNLFLNAGSGEFVEKQIIFSKSGEYQLSCPGASAQLIIIVMEKFNSSVISSDESSSGRSPTSADSDANEWVPRDEIMDDQRDKGESF